MNKLRKGQIVSYNCQSGGGWYGNTNEELQSVNDLTRRHYIYPAKIVEVNLKRNTVLFDHAFFDAADMDTPWVNDTKEVPINTVYPLEFFNMNIIHRAITKTLKSKTKLPRNKNKTTNLFIKEYRKLHNKAVKARQLYNQEEQYNLDQDKEFIIQKIKELNNDKRGSYIIRTIRFELEIEERVSKGETYNETIMH